MRRGGYVNCNEGFIGSCGGGSRANYGARVLGGWQVVG